MTSLQRLIGLVLSLNPNADRLGPGMCSQMQALAAELQADAQGDVVRTREDIYHLGHVLPLETLKLVAEQSTKSAAKQQSLASAWRGAYRNKLEATK